MGSRRDQGRVIGWLGIIAVLGNLLAGVLHMAPANAVVDDILGPLMLCTEHGPQSVPGNALPGDSGRDQREGKSSHCPACTLLAAAPLLVAFLFAAIAFSAGIFRPFESSARTLADHLSLGGIRSRAPPLPA
jgi:hypothetical protein